MSKESKKEIERKFLVKFPQSWGDLSSLFENLIDIQRITQIYLEPNEEYQPSSRVRKTIKGLSGDTEAVYHFNCKKPVEPGVSDEIDYEISKEKYEKLAPQIKHDQVPIEKTRFVFSYQDQIFELDVFKGLLKGLAILEIELENKNDVVELPEFLPVIKELTGDSRYNNFNLANKELHQELKEFLSK